MGSESHHDRSSINTFNDPQALQRSFVGHNSDSGFVRGQFKLKRAAVASMESHKVFDDQALCILSNTAKLQQSAAFVNL